MKLVLVPTPVGNLEDITLRALRVLREAQVVACEDTRRTGILLNHFGIATPRLRLDQHTMGQAREKLAAYQYVAYATDAGTPGLSDPGAELVQLAYGLDWQVEVLPGATALIPALVLSGFPTARFTFEGFLPLKGAERRRRMDQMRQPGYTAVLYEAPHRLRHTLADLAQLYGPDHLVAVVREISKMHEEVFRGSLSAALDHFSEPRGELVLVLAPPEPAAVQASPVDWSDKAVQLRAQGLSGKSLVKALVEAGAPRNQAYQLAHQGREG